MVLGDQLIDLCLNWDEKYRGKYVQKNVCHPSAERSGIDKELSTLRITKKDIDSFIVTFSDMWKTYSEQEKPEYSHKLLRAEYGMFISAMIQRAYNLHENDFYIDMSKYVENKRGDLRLSGHEYISSDIQFVASNLKGSQENPMKITLIGEGYWVSGSKIQNVHLTFEGDVSAANAEKVKNSKVIFRGSSGLACGINSKHSEFEFHGPVVPGAGIDMKHCKISAPSEEILNYLMQMYSAKRRKDNDKYNEGFGKYDMRKYSYNYKFRPAKYPRTLIDKINYFTNEYFLIEDGKKIPYSKWTKFKHRKN